MQPLRSKMSGRRKNRVRGTPVAQMPIAQLRHQTTGHWSSCILDTPWMTADRKERETYRERENGGGAVEGRGEGAASGRPRFV